MNNYIYTTETPKLLHLAAFPLSVCVSDLHPESDLIGKITGQQTFCNRPDSKYFQLNELMVSTFLPLYIVLKSRDITLPTKVCLVKAMVFPAVMYKCESWTIKKTECQRTDAFELWCWRRLSRVPWTARTSNQSIIQEISPEYSLEALRPEAEAPILWPPSV